MITKEFRHKHVRKISLSVFLCLLAAGCRGYSITGGPGKTVPPKLEASTDQSGELLSINSLLISRVEVDPEVQKQSDLNINFDKELQDAVKEQLDLKVLFPEDSAKAGSNPAVKNPLQQARSRDLDGVLFTRVHKFVPRKGTSVSSEQPAVVDVTMRVVRVKDENQVWQSNYHYKDTALSDNLFRIGERAGGWKTAEELLSSGYRSALGDFSSKRLQQFSRRTR